MEKGLKEEVKMIVSSLLVPHSKGLTLEKFLKDYHDYEMKPFPYSQLGYNSPRAFLLSIPDVVHCTVLPSGHLLLQAVANDKVSHIQELVRGQKNSQNGSFRIINKLLRDQPFFARPPPPFVSHRNFQSPNNFPSGPRLYYSHQRSTPRYMNSARIQQAHRPKEVAVLPSRTCSSLESECLLVADFKDVFQPFPEGVEVARVYELYVKHLKRPLLLQKIQENLTLSDLFKRHSNVFRMWDIAGIPMVALRETHHEQSRKDFQPPVSALPQSNNLVKNGSQHISPFKQTPPPVQATDHRQATEPATKPKWVAADIRTQGPGVSSLQTVTVAWDQSRPSTSNSSFRKVAPVPWRPPPRSDQVLPVTFGVTTPKVKNVYEPSTEITRQQFPPDLGDFDYFFLIIAEVYSPGEFYWFLSENRKAIEGLTDDMTLFFTSNYDYFISRGEMYVGQLVAAMYTDNLWYRARILGCIEDEFRVFFVDYGSQNLVTIDRIRHLPLHFTKIPLQAFRGRIFGIRPLPSEKKWSYEAGRSFLNLVKGSKIIAAAKMGEETLAKSEYEITTVYSLTLVDTTNENDVHINDYLIDEGFAVACQEDAFTLQQQSAPDAVTESPTVENVQPVPSPLPTCAFPSLASNHQRPPSECVIPSPIPSERNNGCSSDLINLIDDSIMEIPSKEIQAVSTQSSVSTLPVEQLSQLSLDTHRRQSVKELVLKDERRLYVVEDDGDLYLPKFDMLTLIPSLDRQMEALKMKTDVKVVYPDKDPHIFADCVKVGAPWIINKKNGKLVPQLILYPLNHVLPFLFLFQVKDKAATSAIEAELKSFNEPKA